MSGLFLAAGRSGARLRAFRAATLLVPGSQSCSLQEGQPSSSGRFFCSHGAADADQLKNELLNAALKHIGSRGWTASALNAAAHDLNLSPSIIGLLPRGEGQLVEHFIERCNSQCIAQLDSKRHDLQNLPLDDRITEALKSRLELLIPVIDTWPQALAVATRPSNAPHSLQLLLKFVDDVWHTLGDESTDVTWYSKRAILAGVYTSSSLYMLTDYSPGFSDTWRALRRRVGEGLALEAAVRGAVHAAGAGAHGAPAAEPAGAQEAGGPQAGRPAAHQAADAGAAAAAEPAGSQELEAAAAAAQRHTDAGQGAAATAAAGDRVAAGLHGAVEGVVEGARR